VTAEAVAATLLAFLREAGAGRAVAVLDDDPPVLVEVEGEGTPTASVGEEVRPLLALEEPGPLPHVHAFPPLDVDAEAAEITAPMGAVAHLAGAVRELSRGLPGRSVLTVEWATTDPDAPLTVAARGEDPMVLAIGAEPFEMPAGWP
jgi:hypothetical protein